MTALLLLFAPLAAELAAIYFLSGYLNGRLYRRLGRLLYLLVMWPGVMVHELSHLAACLLTLTKVYEVKLFAPHQEGDSLVLGYVRHAEPAGPLAATLIGSAPFFGGSAALWGVLRLAAPGAASLGPGPAALAKFLADILAGLDWRSWTAYAFLYLVTVLSAHVAPSRPDMVHALKGLIGLAVLMGVFYLVDSYFSLSAMAALVRWLGSYVSHVNALLGYGLFFCALSALATAALEGAVSLFKR